MDTQQLKTTYDNLYASGDMWIRRNFCGIHSAIIQETKEVLRGAHVLDIGCGGGRLSLMLAQFADHVDAFDYTPAAIEMATLLKDLTATRNAHFFVSTLGDVLASPPRATYDVVCMQGVLEHVPDPLATLQGVARLLPPSGLFIIGCPNFLNFRGDAYMTLLTLFDLPMSLTDVWQIDPTHVEAWSAASGLRCDKTVGVMYSFGWLERAARDLADRTPKALRDKPSPWTCHHEKFNEWMDLRVAFNHQFIDHLVAKGVLKSLQEHGRWKVTRPPEMGDAFWQQVTDYLVDDFSGDPYYCETPPYNQMGAASIYFLRKQ